MKALSIWQPHAAFVIAGIKRYETRDWAVQYRGPIAIHAGGHGRNGFTQAEYSHMERLKRFAPVRGVLDRPLVFGAVLGIGELRHCYRTEGLRDYLDEMERALGDFSDERAAWEIEIVEVFDEPIPCKGDKGLWEWSRP